MVVALAQRTVTLAPLYDVASGLIHINPDGTLRYAKNAMSIGGQNRFGEVKGKNWDKLASLTDFSSEFIRGLVVSMAQALPDAVNDAIRELPKKTKGLDIVKNQLLPAINAHVARTIKDLN